MRMKADLHIHTTASDGALAPNAVVRAAAHADFSLIAVTDHDTIAGLEEARAGALAEDIALLPGVELSVASAGMDREIHLLGYGIDPNDATLLRHFERKGVERAARMRSMVDKARALGMEIRLEDVRAMAQGVLSRAHIAKLMVEKGFVPDMRTAFERYLNPGKPVYVPREKTTVAEGCELVREAGGVPVLAHPGLLRMGETALEACVSEWVGQGLAGIEVYHPSHQANHLRFLCALARRKGLLVTGGSDYHGEQMRETHLGDGLDRWEASDADAKALWNAAGTRWGTLRGA